MTKPAPRTLEVIHSRQITPHMLRITLGGQGLKDFPQNQASAYIKLIFPVQGGTRPLMRTYTISGQRSDAIDVDFVIHGTQGPATTWAQNAQPGGQILIGGPGPQKLINTDADWFLFAGDMTALPAITANLSMLPADAQGHAVIEILSESDAQSIPAPKNIKVHWVVNAAPSTDTSPLLECIRQLPRPQGQPAVWVACEFHSMRLLREHFRQEWELPRSHFYISSYWKTGSTEDRHKVEKHEDAQLSGVEQL